MSKKNVKKKDAVQSKKLNDEIFKDAVDDFDRFEDFFETNLRRILAACAILVVLGSAAVALYWYVERKDRLEAASLIEADTPESIKSALSKYPDNIAADEAKMKLATLYFNKKDFAGALKLYENIARSAPVGELKNRAALNVAYTLEAMGKMEEAAEKFSSLANIPSMPRSGKDEASYSAARLFFHIGKTGRAKNALKAVALGKPGFWNAQSEQLAKRLN